MWQEWVEISGVAVLMCIVTTFAMYVAIIVYTRLFGLRSFSKMSAFDFAMTIALGSLFAAAISSPSPTILMGLLSIGLLFFFQKMIAIARGNERIKAVVDNDPLLLMDGPNILHHNLKAANVTVADLHGKLREANVLNYGQVKAVVLESTGDVSVLHGSVEEDLADALLDGVRVS